MKRKVTTEDLFIPKELLEGYKVVEIRRQKGFILVVPTAKRDPILDLGKHPVSVGVSDASEQHDKYCM